MNIEILKRQTRIDSLLNKVNDLNKKDSVDIELIAEFTKYLCVLISGHLEKSIYIILLTYIDQRTNQQVTKFINNKLKKFTNASIGKIEDLLESFNNDWKSELQLYPEYFEMKGNINSLVKDRHAVAHGQTLSLGISKLSNYYKYTKKIIIEIERIVT